MKQWNNGGINMVRLIEENKETHKFIKEEMDKTLLLSSLRDFVKEGVLLTVEKVIKPKKISIYGKINLNCILSIVSEMSKARLYELDKEGQYKMEIDDRTGEEVRSVKVEEYLKDCQVFYPFYANPSQKIEKGETFSEDIEFKITPGTSSYSFISSAYKAADLVPTDFHGAFVTNFAEFEEAVIGFNFIGKYAELKLKSGKKVPYLLCRKYDVDNGRDVAMAATETVDEE